ncbi:MAG: PPC domain-containing protein, partial [Polyangia bacterium]
NTTGPEVVYPFTPTTAGSYTVTLDGLTADLDLIVTKDASSYSCDAASACVQSSTNSGTTSESVTFPADPSSTYYIAVDGKSGAVGNYHIKLASTSCGAATCQDGLASLSCTSQSTSNRNDASGATSDVSTWQCSPVLTGLTGPEFAHAFTPTGAGPYTVKMIGLKADLDLLVIEQGASGICDPSATCVAASSNTGTADESVTFTADPTKSYYFVVDGKNGATSPYTLAITNGCP